MTILRDPTDDDVTAAARGLGMMKLTTGELNKLVEHHCTIELFASKAIVLAAQEVLQTLLKKNGPTNRQLLTTTTGSDNTN